LNHACLIGGLYTLPFDLVMDFEPITQIASEPLLIVGKKSRLRTA